MQIIKNGELNELALFAGGGGGILGGILLGWRTVCAVEIVSYRRKILLARQRDGYLRPFPIWDDVCTFDGRPWNGTVDVISGGFPCQDISPAGKGAGITGEKSGLWKEMARIICEVGPRYVLVENSPLLVSRGLSVVLGDLATLGYDARWGVFSAADIGAPHLRSRLWIFAHANEICCGEIEKNISCRNTGQIPNDIRSVFSNQRIRNWPAEPDVGRVANGLANGMERYAALGDGQVPGVVEMAWKTLSSF